MELTNREIFFLAKEEIKKRDLEVSDSEIVSLLEHVNNFKNYTEFSLNFDENCANPQYFYDLFNKIINGEPLQYVLKSAPFHDFNLYVDKRVLIPRVETEELCLKVLEKLKIFNLKVNTALDMCTGSGCIALFIKKNLKDVNVYASDISEDALDVAIKNAKDNKLVINFIKSDKTDFIIKEHLKFDLLVSNPPYVEKLEDIEEKVRKYEPLNAIYSEDGTAFYENVFLNYQKIMNDEFLMAFEINYDQEEKLTNLIYKYFKKDIEFSFEEDLYGLTRFLFIYRGDKKCKF